MKRDYYKEYNFLGGMFPTRGILLGNFSKKIGVFFASLSDKEFYEFLSFRKTNMGRYHYRIGRDYAIGQKIKRNKGLLINIPHSGLELPQEFKSRLLKDISEEVIYLSDYKVDKLINKNKRMYLNISYSRMYCDVERYNSEKEEMNKFGMGVIYSKDSNGNKFIKLDKDYKESIIENIYDYYHKKLNDLVDKTILRNKKCILVDLHSFSDSFVEKMFNKKDCPDICIGVDNRYTNKELIRKTINHFKKYNYTVKVNYPYKGTIIPNKYLNNKNEKLNSIMIEINKRTYLDENRYINKSKYLKLYKCIDKYLDYLETIEQIDF